VTGAPVIGLGRGDAVMRCTTIETGSGSSVGVGITYNVPRRAVWRRHKRAHSIGVGANGLEGAVQTLRLWLNVSCSSSKTIPTS
jgi:hypothetical protein